MIAPMMARIRATAGPAPSPPPLAANTSNWLKAFMSVLSMNRDWAASPSGTGQQWLLIQILPEDCLAVNMLACFQ
jgi:hypothetical protein